MSAELVLAAAKRGDPMATAVVEEATARIGRVIALLHTLLNPEWVVIGGAVAQAGDVLLQPLRRVVGGLVPVPPRIANSALEDRVVVTGAVHLALDHALLGLFRGIRSTRDAG